MRNHRFAAVANVVVRLWLAAAIVAGLSTSALALETRPNIILILTDDQRFDSLGCLGNRVIRTPHIDALAAQGVVFENMFCTTSICCTSRASYMTGQYARRHQILDFKKSYSADQFAHSFPQLLRQSGYHIGLIGKWGIGGKLPKQDYDYWAGYAGQGLYYPSKQPQLGDHLTDIMTTQALEFLSGCSNQQPFLLQLYTKAAHCQDGAEWQFQPAVRYLDMYAADQTPEPPLATDDAFAKLPALLQVEDTAARVRWRLRFENPSLAAATIKDYYRLITHVDDSLGLIQERLQAMGVADNTIIVWSSDNGFYLGDRRLAGKWYAHEESIRLPLVVYDPRLAAERRGQRRRDLVLNIDLAPTLLEWGGVPVPTTMQGRSLVPLVQGVPWDGERTEFLYEHRLASKSIPECEGVRTREWKLVRYFPIEPPDAPPVYEMFHLTADPHELNNLHDRPEFAIEQAHLLRRLERLIAECQ